MKLMEWITGERFYTSEEMYEREMMRQDTEVELGGRICDLNDEIEKLREELEHWKKYAKILERVAKVEN